MKRRIMRLAGCFLLTTSLLLTPGSALADTFEGVGNGNGGEIKVSVTVEDGAITAIDVIEQNETPGIGDAALEQIPEVVIANQSLGVDVIAGATNSSNGLLEAIEDAVAQAGLDVEALKSTEVAAEEVTYDSERTADVVVIGAGGAGLAAATAALQGGASVLVIEKMPAAGGNSIICGGIYNTPDEELQSVVEMSDSVKSLVQTAIDAEPVNEEHAALIETVKAEYEQYLADGGKGLYDSPNWFALQTWNGGDQVGNLELVKTLTGKAFEDLGWLKDLGMEFSDKIGQGAGS
ncbi:MAG: FAD-binding protein, partial [Blautia sp.]|nr:FAD-binding protein [Blautia sp.]